MSEQGGQPSTTFADARRRLTSNMFMQRYLSHADYAADIAVIFDALDASQSRVRELQTALAWYIRTRPHTQANCPYRQAIGEWCNMCERETADLKLFQPAAAEAAGESES